MAKALYVLLALLIIGGYGYADYRGMGLTRATEIRNVPKSIRDNPGAYRSLYRGTSRPFGGK